MLAAPWLCHGDGDRMASTVSGTGYPPLWTGSRVGVERPFRARERSGVAPGRGA